MSLRGLGYLRDSADWRDWSIDAHPRISAARVLAEVTLRPFAGPVADQQTSSSCVGFALAAAFDIRACLQGLPAPRISPRAIYTLARAGDGPLVDIGCRPRDALRAISKYGLVSEVRVPFSVEDINRPLPWDVFRAGHDARAAKYWRIDAIGNDRVDRMRQAISAGYPCFFATPVDSALDSYRAGDVVGPVRGPDRGGHAMLAIGYRVTDGAFDVRNSWSSEWGDGGHCWVSPERIAGIWTTDAWCLEATSPGVH